MRVVGHELRGYVRRLLGVLAAALALLVAGAPVASAEPDLPRLAVAGSDPTSVSLLATGFPRDSTVEFSVRVGGCTGRASVVATADALLVRFVTGPDCTGAATATATDGARSATIAFTFGAPDAARVPADAAAQDPGRRAVRSECTVRVEGGAPVPDTEPGDVVCFTGTLPKRLQIRGGGSAEKPVTYSGLGTATVPGVTARGDNIVLEGFVSKGAKDNGFYVVGNNITIRDNDISEVYIDEDDVDAIRFFGDGITIAHNTAHDIWANPSEGRKPHTDCMQTYASSEPASSNIRIEGNFCASPQFRQCIMAEGPNDDDGDGKGSGVGRSQNWLVTNNHFECHAPAQTVALQDIHDVTFSANDFMGSGKRAIALQKDATGATVTDDNIKGPGYRMLVSIDHESARQGYKGPDN